MMPLLSRTLGDLWHDRREGKRCDLPSAVMEASFPDHLEERFRLVIAMRASLAGASTSDGGKVVVGACLGLQEQWKTFGREWDKALRDRWNMDEFNTRRFCLDSHWRGSLGEDRNREVWSEALKMVERATMTTFAVIFPTSDYLSSFAGGERTIKDAYRIAAFVCLTKVILYLSKRRPDYMVSYLLEHLGPGAEGFREVLEDGQRDPRKSRILRLASISTVDRKRFPALQAAGLIASQLLPERERRISSSKYDDHQNDYTQRLLEVLHPDRVEVERLQAVQFDRVYRMSWRRPRI